MGKYHVITLLGVMFRSLTDRAMEILNRCKYCITTFFTQCPCQGLIKQEKKKGQNSSSYLWDEHEQQTFGRPLITKAN